MELSALASYVVGSISPGTGREDPLRIIRFAPDQVLNFAIVALEGDPWGV